MEEVKTLTEKKIWCMAALLAVLLHAGALLLNFTPALKTMPRVEIQPLSIEQIEKIRAKWNRTSKNKQLLLNKNPTLEPEKEAPPDARYYSDRNTRVKKEQTAAKTQVIPTPDRPALAPPPSTSRAQTSPKVPDGRLQKLGVPFHFPPLSSRIQSPGGDQALLDKTLPIGSENLLNTEQFIYYSFYARIYESIGPIWQSLLHNSSHPKPLNPGDYTTVVDAVFDKDGNLLEIRQLQSSTVNAFDAAVEMAWEKTNRFPNPPKELLNEKGEIHTGWTFTVQVGSGVGWEIQAPGRVY